MRWPWSRKKEEPPAAKDIRKLVFIPQEDITTYELAKVMLVILEVRDRAWYQSEAEIWIDIQRLESNILRHFDYRLSPVA